jgi:hypothetical protein
MTKYTGDDEHRHNRTISKSMTVDRIFQEPMLSAPGVSHGEHSRPCAKPRQLMPLKRRRREQPVRRRFIIEIVCYGLSTVLACQDWRIGSPLRITGSLDKPMLPPPAKPIARLRGWGESNLLRIDDVVAGTCGRAINLAPGVLDRPRATNWPWPTLNLRRYPRWRHALGSKNRIFARCGSLARLIGASQSGESTWFLDEPVSKAFV